ncbi:phospholipase D family protein [Methanococcoides sp. NM1]|uniref:phospholipase D family protein n=1 Tax=Methanococcoides sp. NM1 TaxID=1201013 RepID=UPI0010824855|nr:phospholipase D family protein [Methanococcoides sp. NM1]
MVEFLNTEGTSYKLNQLIKNADHEIVLISPFLKINQKIKNLIENQDRKRTTDIKIIYGKNELQPDENNWIKQLVSVRLAFCKDLHAKCYLSEKEAIITSMNLYEYSQVNNYEMGIYASKENDPSLYHEIYIEAMDIFKMSDELKITIEKVESKEDKKVETKQKHVSAKMNGNKNKTETGFCVRCQDQIKLDPMYPYCKKCFTSWNKYKNEEYKEKYCHICGKTTESSKMKPTCYNCYKKHKKDFNFPM